MEMTSLIMPAIVGGLMLYGKSKASAAFNWIMSDEASVKSMPVALLLTQISSGDALPAPPAGYTWNPIEVNFSSSPFSSPQTLVINVQVPIPGYVAPAAPAPAAAPASATTPTTTGASGFLTSQSLVSTAKRIRGGAMGGFLTTQEILPAGLNGFFSREAFEEAGGGMGQMSIAPAYCGTERYQGPPAAIPGSAGPLGALGTVLRARGLVLAPVGPGAVCKGDYVVTMDGALYVSHGGGQFKQIHPVAGYVGPLKAPFQSAYGVRRA
jgi:hypothetical protein